MLVLATYDITQHSYGCVKFVSNSCQKFTHFMRQILFWCAASQMNKM